MCRTRLMLLLAALIVVALPVVAAEPSTAEPSNDKTAAASACQRCGDGYCARSCENERTCPADCAPQTAAAAPAARCGKCGDGTCVPQCGETSTSCPADCGGGEPSAMKANAPKCQEPANKQAEPKKE